MSLKTQVENLRTALKIRQEVANAQIQAASDSIRSMPMFGVMFALGFAFLLMALAGVGAPVQAGTINDSISPILEDAASLMTPLLTLITSAIPLIIAVAIISFVLGILAAILGKLHV